MGTSLWWALLPIVILAGTAIFVQLHDGWDIIVLGYLHGADSLRRAMVWTFLESHLAIAWAALACLVGVGWLAVAPSHRSADA